RADFIHKLRIALKELRESRCWIRLIIKAGLLPKQQLSVLLDENDQLCNIIGKSIVTTKARTLKPR
ncbi:MAG TPA: four helix bundle protein, partial [Gemmataceae bacterium]